MILAELMYGLKPVPFKLTHYQRRGMVEIPAKQPYDKAADEFVRPVAVSMPAGGEMSGLTAHFLFGRSGPGFFSRIPAKNRNTAGQASPHESRLSGGVVAMAVKLDEIRAAAQRVAASHGLDVVDLEFIGPAKERTLRIFLEKNAEGRAKLKADLQAGIEAGEKEDLPERLVEGKLSLDQLSGVTHEDCAEFSKDFGVLLDVEDLVPGDQYLLEASSPGLDRKLSRKEDFGRFSGCLVKIQTFDPIRNNRHWQGRLMAGADQETVTLDLSAVKQNSKSRKTGVNTVEIAFKNIEKAQLVPEI
jgi:ribosome maturation factor RimP